VSIAGEYEEADIWVYEIERGSWTRLTNGMHTWPTPVWAPDGKWIFFTSFTSGEGELFRIPSRGGSPEQLTSDIKAWEYAGSVSPDGTTLLFWKSLPSQSDLMTMPIEPQGSPVPFTDSPTVGETSPRISPDGRWVAYDSDESGSRQVHVRPFPGPGEGFRVSPQGGAGPAWSRDGREIVYQRRQEIWAVAVQPGSTFRHANPRMLFKVSENLSGSLASGEGTTRFLAIRREQPKPLAQQLVYAPNWVEELAHVRSSR
jgi:serine/threonine-protein kinase